MRSLLLSALCLLPSVCSAAGLTTEEQARVEQNVVWIDSLLVLFVFALIGFALSIRYIAKRTTFPCPSCMEFIAKKETVCPKCGKPLGSAAKS